MKPLFSIAIAFLVTWTLELTPAAAQGEADLRNFASLSCNPSSPSSTNVAAAIYAANQAGYTYFLIPAGCYWDTTSVPGGSGWSARTIPSGFHVRGENWTQSGIYADTSHSLVFGGYNSLDNLYYVSQDCFNLDAGVYGHPAMCPLGHAGFNAGGNGSYAGGYPFQPRQDQCGGVAVPAFGGNSAINYTVDNPCYSIILQSQGDGLFMFDISAGNFLNFWDTNGPVFQVVAQYGHVNIGNSGTPHNGGSITITDNGGACTMYANPSGQVTSACWSDERLKHDIVDSPSQLAWLASFRLKDFTMNNTGERRTGVIAQEMQSTHPEMVHSGPLGTDRERTPSQYLAVEGPDLWKMMKVMQEMQAEIDELKGKLTLTKAREARKFN